MYESLKRTFRETFGRAPEYLFSAPGRTELSGNHTDHQRGCVLAGAVNLDTVAAVARNGENRIRFLSEGYPLCELSLDELTPRPEEQGTTAALIRGVAAGFDRQGLPLNGFDACAVSSVPAGSGLSSSAAFEVLVGCILNHLGGCGLPPETIARIGQYAENVYFGKPCGLMDQTACAVGNIIGIDFADPAHPDIHPIDFDFSSSGHALCIIDTGADHADLTDEYAAIPEELRQVCAYFGKEVLREVPEEAFYAALPGLRQAVGDRAVLRAMHVFEENKRVARQIAALERGDSEGFLEEVRASGRSSWLYLQNITPAGQTRHQEVAFTLALAQRLLGNRGGCRVHGGGFAGTIQAFVPNDLLEQFGGEMERVLGSGRCHILSIRREGGVLLEAL